MSYDALDEWLFEYFTESSIQFIFELIERRYDNTATIFCTQYPKKDWHSRLGGWIHADSIMDRIVHNAAWIFAGIKLIFSDKDTKWKALRKHFRFNLEN